MPEILEVETARALIGQASLGRESAAVDAPDAWFLKRGLDAATAAEVLTGRRLVTARRRGKLLLVDTDRSGPVLGLHLGMSGRVVIDGREAGDPLVYASNADRQAWYRFGVRFVDGGSLRLRDPRRLGGVELDPDEDRLGVDAFTLDRNSLDAALRTSKAPLKAVLMDQSRIAGLGNLLTDEALWHAGLDPARPAGDLDAAERRQLLTSIRRTLRVLGRRGGSHTGELMVGRTPGGICPRDGTPLVRRAVGGRTTYSCPLHQV
jgi:formamidopyrimidine-DNA glycosylase